MTPLKYYIILFNLFFWVGCASNKTPVNKTYLQKVTPSEKLAKAYEKQMKQADKEKKNPEAMIKKLERRHNRIRKNMEVKKSFGRIDFQAFRKRIKKQAIYSAYH